VRVIVSHDLIRSITSKVLSAALGPIRSVQNVLLMNVDCAASITAAVASGARLVTGGQQDGTVIAPTIVADVDPYSPFAQDELFGPAVAVSTARDLAHAIELANSTAYGLGAGIFTNNLASSIRAIREIESGVVHVNWTQLWRADLMPYGGFKSSGIGKEGPRSAVDEMTEIKTVILHGTPWDN
jgi:glyceraldehyde-3-phosphate dehydrogenase (NADP+)